MRNTNLNDVIFPVKDMPLLYGYQNEAGTLRFRDVDNKKALVNMNNDNLLGIVSNDYRFIDNEQAIKYGKKCIATIFPDVKPDNIVVFNIITPSTQTWCHIDLIHKGYEINIWKQEIYLPFIRITNSYNTSRALRFEIGFCRKLCDNGVIFERKTIVFYFPHTKESIKDEIDFKVNPGFLRELENEFKQLVVSNTDITIQQGDVFPLVCKVLELKFDIHSPNRKRSALEYDRLRNVRNNVRELTEKYFGEFGMNAYAVFNIITDFCSNVAKDNRRDIIRIHGSQKRTGKWLEDFPGIYKSADFSWDSYLADYRDYAA
ncbi:MAG TPA: DUF932 domain-containing protein [Syntrophorhabdaceae bacterium]|nr:DUF932 domain-containing protein [Syntrophorhabdaceae bacterium]